MLHGLVTITECLMFLGTSGAWFVWTILHGLVTITECLMFFGTGPWWSLRLWILGYINMKSKCWLHKKLTEGKGKGKREINSAFPSRASNWLQTCELSFRELLNLNQSVTSSVIYMFLFPPMDLCPPETIRACVQPQLSKLDTWIFEP